MDWIRLHAGLPGHPKIGRLARRLKVDRLTAIGVVIRLLCFTASSKETGELNGTDPEDIAESIGWGGDAHQLVAALIACGWIDKVDSGLVVHDWLTYNSSVFAHRQSVKRQSLKSKPDISLTSDCRQPDDRLITTDRQTDRQLPPLPPLPSGVTKDGLLQIAKSKRIQAKDAKSKGDDRNAHRLAGEAEALEAQAGALR